MSFTILEILSHFNLVKCLFVLMALGILFMSLLLNFCEPRLPAAIVQTFRYGKFSYMGKKSFISYFEVPKSWFRHFYVIASIYSLLIIYIMISLFVFGLPVPQFVVNFLNFIGTPNRKSTVSGISACLATSLLCIQIWKRLYETCFISIFSNSKINIVHYLIGIIHYLGALTAIVLETPGFALPSFKHKVICSYADLNLNAIFGSFIFLWACYNQLKSATILANLRKDEAGNVVTYSHKLPSGGLFERLSSPHMFCEMLMYLALNLILWSHTTWPYVFLWVFCNQCETALLSHWWYKSKFKEYPKRRKAFLPFIL